MLHIALQEACSGAGIECPIAPAGVGHFDSLHHGRLAAGIGGASLPQLARIYEITAATS